MYRLLRYLICYFSFSLVQLLVAKHPLYAQPVLIDSIEQRLRVENDDGQRMDLLVGLCRASLFTHGGEQIKPIVARAKDHALKTSDSIGLGRALLFEYMSDFVIEEGIPEEVEMAFKLGQSTGDRNLELFAVYHLAEHYLYDKNDLTNTQKWLAYGRKRLNPKVNPKHRGNIYKVTALYYEARGQRDSMDYWLEAALTEFQRVNAFISPQLGRTPSGNWDNGLMNQAQVLNYQGNNAVARGDFKEAQQKLTTALSIAREWRVDNILSRTLENIGELQTAIGDTEGAIASFSSALDIHKAQQNKLYASNTAQKIGQLFLLANDGKAASRFYERAARDAAAISDTIAIINSQLGLAWSAQMQGNLPSAMAFLSEGEELAVRSKDTISQSYLRSERARQTYIDGRYEESIGVFQEAIALHQRYQHENNIQTDYMGMARAHLALGQTEEALTIITKAEEIVKRLGSIHKQRETAELFAKIAEAINDLPQAVKQHKRIQAINDSLNQQDAQTSLRREEVRQNVNEFRLENEALEREGQFLAQRNKLYLALAGALLLLLAIGGYLLFRLRTAQRALAESNDELKALNATKDRFFGIIAHDIRSPIIALNSVGDQLRFYLSKERTEKATEVADNVSLTTKRLSRLLDQLLSWALLQQGTMPHNPESLSLAKVVEEVIELFEQAGTTKGVTLDYKVPEALLIQADAAGLHTMLRNLVSNAIKFTPRGGSVTVSAQRSSGSLVVEVKDNGIGMVAGQAQEILMENGRSNLGTDGERGSGLGLRLVRDIAKLHSGDLTVESKPGVGSSFRLTFPA